MHVHAVEQLLDAYRIHLLAAGLGVGTVRLRVGTIRRMAAVLDVLAATLPDLERYLADRRSTLKPESRKSIRTSIRSFYAWAHDAGHLPTDPAARLLPVRIPATVPRLAADDDIQGALSAASADVRAMILLARLACLRRAEIASLHTRDRHRDLIVVTGKGEKQRRVYLNSQLAAALDDLAGERDGGYWFPGRFTGHVHVDTVYDWVLQATGWNTHSLRHAGATAAYRATHDLRAVQEMLGHASIATTERYLHVDEQALRAVSAATAFRPAA